LNVSLQAVIESVSGWKQLPAVVIVVTYEYMTSA